MSILHFLKNNFFLQNLAARLWAFTPAYVDHNLEKYKALKKTFFITSEEQIPGDYLEFGVFTGSSFVFACRMGQKTQKVHAGKTRYFGFDSFKGFGKLDPREKHPFYTNENFAVDGAKVKKNILRQAGQADVQLVEGFYNETIQGKTAKGYGIESVRICFIDCDLKSSAALALEFIQPSIIQGTFLMMDDFLAYRGDLTQGVAGAFEDFKQKYPDIKWRHAFDFGAGGIVFVCHFRSP